MLALLSDSTNAERPGFTATEQKVAAGVRSLFARARNKRIIIATFASNIYRVQQIIDLAVEDGRKVAFSGRSMVNNTAMAQELGYMHIPEGTLIGVEELTQYPPEPVSYTHLWCCYVLGLFVCAALQTTPGLFQLGQAKPLLLLPLCLAVSVCEGEFAGALFGMVCGLLWDYTAGRTVGMLALEMMLLCFAVGVLVQLYLQSAPGNFAVISAAAALLVLSCRCV